MKQTNSKFILYLCVFIIGFILGALILWYSFDENARCEFLHDKNLCIYYKVLQMDPTLEGNFDRMTSYCTIMDYNGKKDSCFESIALAFNDMDKSKAKESCDKIRDSIIKDRCYNLYVGNR